MALRRGGICLLGLLSMPLATLADDTPGAVPPNPAAEPTAPQPANPDEEEAAATKPSDVEPAGSGRETAPSTDSLAAPAPTAPSSDDPPPDAQGTPRAATDAPTKTSTDPTEPAPPSTEPSSVPIRPIPDPTEPSLGSTEPSPSSTEPTEPADGPPTSPTPSSAEPHHSADHEGADAPPHAAHGPDEPPAGVGKTPDIRAGEPHDAVDSWIYPLLPRFRFRGIGPFLFLSVMTVLSVALAATIRRVRFLFLPTGVIPSGLAGLQHFSRIFAVLLGLGAIGAVIPPGLEAVLPLIVITAAVAIGWSARDLAADLVAGVALATERSFEVGDYVQLPNIADGRVEHFGFRGVLLQASDGQLVPIPNRELLRSAIRVDSSPWPSLEVAVAVPPGLRGEQVREILEGCCALSPWLAPEDAVQLIGPSAEPGVWTVRARLLDVRFAETFAVTLREAVNNLDPALNRPSEVS